MESERCRRGKKISPFPSTRVNAHLVKNLALRNPSKLQPSLGVVFVFKPKDARCDEEKEY